jgi:hypothetical protein
MKQSDNELMAVDVMVRSTSFIALTNATTDAEGMSFRNQKPGKTKLRANKNNEDGKCY